MTDPRRRDFLRYSTLLVGSSPLLGCGGSSGGDTSGVDPVTPPVITPPVTTPPVVTPPVVTPPVTTPPVTTPVPSTGARQFSLLSSTTVTAPFCVGFALRQGDIPPGSGVAVSGATAQVTIKNAWPDGSAKFAIVAGTAPLVADVATIVSLAAGAPSAGPAVDLARLQAVMTLPVTVGCGAYGSVSWSGADWASPFDAWVTGPRMSSWLYRKPVGSDAHLVAWLEVRLWDTGEVEVLPWIENGYVLVPGPTSKGATYSFEMGGTTRFSDAIDLPHHCRTPLLKGGITSHWLGTAHDVIVKHDSDYLQATGMVPAYMARTPTDAAVVLGLPSTFTPLQQGSWPNGMGAGGYSPSIGLLPEWDALYLTCAAPGTFKAVIFNAYAAGRYGFHYRDELNNRPTRLGLHPTLNIRPPDVGWETTPATSGTASPPFSVSHQPSVAFVAYLISGRRYFLDELQMVAGANAIGESSSQREGARGIWKTTAAGATRHVAWAMRTLAQAIAVTPDGDADVLTDYRTQYQNNIDYYHARYIAQTHNPFGFVTPYSDYSNVAGTVAAGATTTVIPCNPGALGGAPYNITSDGQYVGQKLTIGAETRTVTAYSIATETLTVAPGFSSAPAAGTGFGVNDGICFDSPWMGDFLTAALGYARDLSIGLDASSAAKFEAFYAWKARSVIGRLGSTAATDFLYRDYAPYAMAVAPFDSPGGLPVNDSRWNSGVGPWFADWGAIYAATFGGATPPGSSYPGYASPGPRVDGELRPYLSPEFPAAEALPAIAYAVKHGLPGAAEAYQRLTTAANWPQFLVALDRQPVWAVASGVFVR